MMNARCSQRMALIINYSVHYFVVESLRWLNYEALITRAWARMEIESASITCLRTCPIPAYTGDLSSQVHVKTWQLSLIGLTLVMCSVISRQHSQHSPTTSQLSYRLRRHMPICRNEPITECCFISAFDIQNNENWILIALVARLPDDVPANQILPTCFEAQDGVQPLSDCTVLKVYLPPPGLIRSTGTWEYQWLMAWSWQVTDHYDVK